MNNKIISKVVAGTVLCSMIGYVIPVFAYTKDETVYSKLDANGSNYKTIVSTHIQNEEDEDLINDLSNLINITNTNGDETFKQDGEKLTWNANKNDIYYQGETDKELPISVEAKYELDGKEMKPEEIAGKTGKVKITLNYQNKEMRYVNVNGKTVKMYVPFVVLAGTIINNDKNQNITISNGKIVNDGTKTIAIGMCMPGLQESLNVNKSDVDIPSSIEITMDATEFEQNSIVSYVTPKVFEEDDIKALDKLDTLYSDVNKMQEASKKIEDGANQLKDGTTSLNEGANKLDSGAQELNNGASTLTAGIKTIDSNMSSIVSGTNELVNGQKQVTNGLNQIQSNLPSSKDIEDSKQKLEYLNSQNTEAVKELTAANTLIDSKLDEVEKQQTDVNTQLTDIKTKLEAIAKLNGTDIDGLIKYSKTLNDKTDTNNLRATIGLYSLLNTTQKSLVDTKETLTKQKDANNKLIKLISGNETAIKSSVESLDSMSTLNKGISTLQSGSKKLQTGANKLNSGSKQLKDGTSKLLVGSQKLTDGTSNLTSGTTELKNGTEKLNNGATELAEGITTFNKEGIEKIANYINGNVKDLDGRISKLTDLSKEYNNFTMLDEGNKGEVKFIMIIDKVKKQEDSEQDKQEAADILNSITNNEEEKEENNK